MSSSQPAQPALSTQSVDAQPVESGRPSAQVKPQKKASQRPNTFLTAIGGLMIVLVTAAVVSSLIGDEANAAPGLRKSTARPSVLKDAGYVRARTTGPGIERY